MSATANADQEILEIRDLIERQMAEARAIISERARASQQPPAIPTRVKDLMAIESDEWFVKYAYLTLLGRHGDLPGLQRYIDSLGQGRVTRDEILIAMSRSRESRRGGRKIPLVGLHAQFARLRVYASRWAPWLVSAFSFVRNLARLNRLQQEVTKQLRRQEFALAQMDQRLQGLMDFSGSLKRQFDHRAATPAPDQPALNQHVDTATRAPQAPAAVKHDLDAFINDFFSELSERFRGSEPDILQRNRIYSDILQRVGSTNPDVPVLDIACGRGEMLHVASDLGLKAIGIDLNDRLIAYCRAKSLDVFKSDALSFIQSREDASLAAITTTHFVEHLEFDYLVQTLRESYRALRPGGGIIIETPNPLNLVVSTVQFYMDPSHRNPIPMVLMQLLLEKIGFVVTPIDLSARGLDVSMGSVEHPQLNCLLNSPQDYALLGIKPQ